jgi:hypothetical protein
MTVLKRLVFCENFLFGMRARRRIQVASEIRLVNRTTGWKPILDYAPECHLRFGRGKSST